MANNILKKLVIIEPFGQLGNRLYRLANVIAFAREFGLQVIDFSFCVGGYSLLFAETRRRALLQFPNALQLPFCAYHLQNATYKFFQKLLSSGNWRPIILENETQEYALSMPDLSKYECETICLKGFHFQADEYVAKHAEYLRSLFRPLPNIVKTVDEYFSNIKSDYDLVIGVHIRHGDFKGWNDGEFFFETNDYAAIMQQVINLFYRYKIYFLIFSDNHFLDLDCFHKFEYAYQKNSMDHDLYLMSKCDYLLAPQYTTYSGWASFYGQVPIYRISNKNKVITKNDFEIINVLNNFVHRNR